MDVSLCTMKAVLGQVLKMLPPGLQWLSCKGQLWPSHSSDSGQSRLKRHLLSKSIYK
jgi:hypothetical protein